MKRNTGLMKWFLVLVIVLGVAVISGASAELGSGTCGTNLTWVLSDDGVLTISGTGSMTSYQSNSTPWKNLSSKIKIVDIGTGVTQIGSYAFYNCSNLTSITIPASVTSIGSNAFYNCEGLTSITIPDSLTSIGSGVFTNCSGKRYANMDSEGAKALSKAGYSFRTPGSNYDLIYVYSDQEITGLRLTRVDKDITEFTVPDSVTSIGDWAFDNCSSLTSITIPDNVTSIGSYAFYNCSKLTDIHIETLESWLGISYADAYSHPNHYYQTKNCHLFIGENELTDITIPEGMTSIGSYAFYNCSSLTSITIPDSVTSIGDYAFYICSNLTSITIPDSVTSIGGNAFENCSKLTDIHIESIEFWMSISNGDIHSLPTIRSPKWHLFIGDNELADIIIPDNVTSIGSYAFRNCSSLTSITIPESVTSIGDLAFNGCSSLASITIPNSVTSIGTSAFGGCSSLTSITIPDSVTSIGISAFGGCSSLASITIQNSVTSIGNYAFSSCRSLKSIRMTGAKSIGEGAFKGCDSSLLTELILPEGLTSIGEYAFEDCDGIKNVYIPDSVTYIGERAFGYCNALTNIRLPAGITRIKPRTFFYCRALQNIVIPDSVTYIDREAFYLCEKAVTISFPETVEYIGDDAFRRVAADRYNYYNCNNAATVKCYRGTYAETYFRNLNQNGGDGKYNYIINVMDFDPATCKHRLLVTDPATAPTYARTGLTNGLHCGNCGAVLIPQRVIPKIDMFKEELKGMKVLKLPASLTSVEEESFMGSSAQAVLVPENCRSIGSRAFANCSALKYVILQSDNVSIAADAFDGSEDARTVVVDLSEDLEPLFYYHTSARQCYWIHELFGKTIKQANLLLEDELVYGDGFYYNEYFGVQVDDQGHINWISVFNGKKYSLFNSLLGEGAQTVPNIRGCQQALYYWEPDSSLVNPAYLTSKIYPDRIIMLTWKNYRLESITYGVY